MAPGRRASGLERLGASLYERPDDGTFRVALRVPLDAKHESTVRHLDRFRQTVINRPACHVKPISNPVNALVMVLHTGVNELSGDKSGKRVGGQSNVVRAADE